MPVSQFSSSTGKRTLQRWDTPCFPVDPASPPPRFAQPLLPAQHTPAFGRQATQLVVSAAHSARECTADYGGSSDVQQQTTSHPTGQTADAAVSNMNIPNGNLHGNINGNGLSLNGNMDGNGFGPNGNMNENGFGPNNVNGGNCANGLQTNPLNSIAQNAFNANDWFNPNLNCNSGLNPNNVNSTCNDGFNAQIVNRNCSSGFNPQHGNGNCSNGLNPQLVNGDCSNGFNLQNADGNCSNALNPQLVNGDCSNGFASSNFSRNSSNSKSTLQAHRSNSCVGSVNSRCQTPQPRGPVTPLPRSQFASRKLKKNDSTASCSSMHSFNPSPRSRTPMRSPSRASKKSVMSLYTMRGIGTQASSYRRYVERFLHNGYAMTKTPTKEQYSATELFKLEKGQDRLSFGANMHYKGDVPTARSLEYNNDEKIRKRIVENFGGDRFLHVRVRLSDREKNLRFGSDPTTKFDFVPKQLQSFNFLGRKFELLYARGGSQTNRFKERQQTTILLQDDEIAEVTSLECSARTTPKKERSPERLEFDKLEAQDWYALTYFAVKFVGNGEESLDPLDLNSYDSYWDQLQPISINDVYLYHLHDQTAVELLINSGKLVKRLRLGFTDAIPTIVIRPEQVLPVHDIIWFNEKRGEVITNDGQAYIHYDLAREIAEKLGLDYVPAAIQGRLKNSKGIWISTCDEAYKGKICLSKSQRKFEIADWTKLTDRERTLEVKECSPGIRDLKPHKGGISHQIMLILESLASRPDTCGSSTKNGGGVSSSSRQEQFYALCRQLQKDGLEIIENYFESSEALLESLPRKMSHCNDDVKLLKQLLQAGFRLEDTPFLAAAGGAYHHQEVLEKYLTGSRFVFPGTYSLFMIADNESLLEHDEMILCINGNYISQNVLACRTPTNIDTDIQKYKCLSKSEVWKRFGGRFPHYEHVNVAVLSSKLVPNCGRPPGDLHSGGDYDGDTLMVMTHQPLVDIIDCVQYNKAAEFLREHKEGESKARKDQLLQEQGLLQQVSQLSPQDAIKEEINSSLNCQDRVALLTGRWVTLADVLTAGQEIATAWGWASQEAIDGTLTPYLEILVRERTKALMDSSQWNMFPDLNHEEARGNQLKLRKIMKGTAFKEPDWYNNKKIRDGFTQKEKFASKSILGHLYRLCKNYAEKRFAERVMDVFNKQFRKSKNLHLPLAGSQEEEEKIFYTTCSLDEFMGTMASSLFEPYTGMQHRFGRDESDRLFERKRPSEDKNGSASTKRRNVTQASGVAMPGSAGEQFPTIQFASKPVVTNQLSSKQITTTQFPSKQGRNQFSSNQAGNQFTTNQTNQFPTKQFVNGLVFSPHPGSDNGRSQSGNGFTRGAEPPPTFSMEGAVAHPQPGLQPASQDAGFFGSTIRPGETDNNGFLNNSRVNSSVFTQNEDVSLLDTTIHPDYMPVISDCRDHSPISSMKEFSQIQDSQPQSQEEMDQGSERLKIHTKWIPSEYLDVLNEEQKSDVATVLDTMDLKQNNYKSQEQVLALARRTMLDKVIGRTCQRNQPNNTGTCNPEVSPVPAKSSVVKPSCPLKKLDKMAIEETRRDLFYRYATAAESYRHCMHKFDGAKYQHDLAKRKKDLNWCRFMTKLPWLLWKSELTALKCEGDQAKNGESTKVLVDIKYL